MNKTVTLVTGRLMPQSFVPWMNSKLVELMLQDREAIKRRTEYRLTSRQDRSSPWSCGGSSGGAHEWLSPPDE